MTPPISARVKRNRRSVLGLALVTGVTEGVERELAGADLASVVEQFEV